jgi:DNA-binding NarL/FixJ family response regulator
MRGAYEALLARVSDLELCGTAESAEEAMDVLGQHPCDLLITDVSLPGMDGIRLTERVRHDNPALPILVVSVDEGYRVRAEHAGANCFLSKNGLAQQLVPTIRELLQMVEARREGQRAEPRA